MKSVRAFVFLLVILPAWWLTVAATRGLAQEDDSAVSEMEQRKRITQHAAELLSAENFAELEKTADEFRTNKTRLPSGFWKLYNFYEGTECPHDGSTGNDWVTHLARLEKWRAQYPQSITVYTTLAATYVNYAWQARGNGYANTVTDEGWQLFRDRIHQAEGYVEAGRKLPVADPQLDCEELIIGGKGLGWDLRQYNSVFDDAVKREPEYLYLYLQKAEYLLPRWSGRRGDIERFALQAVRLTQDTQGKAIYARLAGSLRRYLHEGEWFFDVYRFPWPDVRDGFRDLEKQYPHSEWNLNLFCWMACHARDCQTARELFQRIGDRWDADIWGNEGAYRTWKKWAESPATQPSAAKENAEELPLWKRVLREWFSW